MEDYEILQKSTRVQNTMKDYEGVWKTTENYKWLQKSTRKYERLSKTCIMQIDCLKKLKNYLYIEIFLSPCGLVSQKCTYM